MRGRAGSHRPGPVRVPISALQPATLRSLVEEFITREGTDYGDVEKTLEEKVSEVMLQLERGLAAIEYDDDSETVTLIKVR